MRANVFRFAPDNGRRATWSACPFRAQISVAEQIDLLIIYPREQFHSARTALTHTCLAA